MLLWSVNAELLKLDGLLFGRKSEITHLACPSASITGTVRPLIIPWLFITSLLTVITTGLSVQRGSRRMHNGHWCPVGFCPHLLTAWPYVSPPNGPDPLDGWNSFWWENEMALLFFVTLILALMHFLNGINVFPWFPVLTFDCINLGLFT